MPTTLTLEQIATRIALLEKLSVPLNWGPRPTGPRLMPLYAVSQQWLDVLSFAPYAVARQAMYRLYGDELGEWICATTGCLILTRDESTTPPTTRVDFIV